MKRISNTLGKLNWWRGAGSLFVLCMTAIALPAQTTLTTLFSFDYTDGEFPQAALVRATNGDVYGTSFYGGAGPGPAGSGSGTIFKITPSGTLTTLYTFCAQSGCGDGANPFSALVQATDGDLYGTTALGGAFCDPPYGCGTIFKFTPGGTLTTLHSFCAQGLNFYCPEGQWPVAGLVQAANGDFYGTTEYGGTYNDGTVFKITPGGTFTSLYSFCPQIGCADGQNPETGLVQATNGDLYGTTFAGGNDTDDGTVFKITPSGTLTTVYSFPFCSLTKCKDGYGPLGGLIQAANGHLYGTTSGGSVDSNGTIFEITPSGALTTLYRFCSQGVYPDCPDGAAPVTGLVQATDGNLYGTTTLGPNGSGGTAFKMTPDGTLTTLYTFCSQTGCADGESPSAALVQGTDGKLYGTTLQGGTPNSASTASSCGTLFSLSVGLGPFVETQTTYGKVGAAVKILGTDLTGATSVTFNGTAAGFTVASSSEIITAVPAGASTGSVQVVTPSGTLSSNVPFRVLP